MYTMNDVALYLLVLCLVSIGFITLLYFLTSRSKYHFQRRSLKQYELVISLIRNIQQHRGLSQGVIAGEAALNDKLHSVQREISYLVESLNISLTGRLAERWDSFFDHWSRLRGTSTNVEAEDSFQQHNYMINNLLYLAESICNNSDLGYSVNHSKDQLLWRQLLVLSECIGQARALGSSALARGNASYLELIRFQLLSEKIDDRLHSMDASLSSESMLKLENAIGPVNSALKQFLMNLEAYPHSSQEYFSIASVSLEHVLSVLDDELEILKSRYQVFHSRVGKSMVKHHAMGL